jgi:hypothetical protein
MRIGREQAAREAPGGRAHRTWWWGGDEVESGWTSGSKSDAARRRRAILGSLRGSETGEGQNRGGLEGGGE